MHISIHTRMPIHVHMPMPHTSCPMPHAPCPMHMHVYIVRLTESGPEGASLKPTAATEHCHHSPPEQVVEWGM